MVFSRPFHDAAQARQMARKHLPWMVFDYIDGAAGREHGAALNAAALSDIRLQPRIFTNVGVRDVSMRVFEHSAQRPFGISPMGMCNLAHPKADKALAHLAAQYHTPLGVSTVSSSSLENMIEWAEGHAWFQLYISGDGSSAQVLIRRAIAAGYKTLVITADVPEVGYRARELRHGFKVPFRIGPWQFMDFACHPRWSLNCLWQGPPQMANFIGGQPHFDRHESRAGVDWHDLKKLRDIWQGNLVVKGVLNIDDAVRLKQIGIDAIQVSSHGSRQLDAAPCPILMLADMRAALGPHYPIFYDSGIRSGEDVIKAYAMGADYVFVGRAFLFALAAQGAKGAQRISDILAEEASLTLAQLGRTNMKNLHETRAN